MREFKFRAWDSVNKIMYSPDEFIEMNAFNHFLRGGCKVIIVTQYTGMKDKNGKEIFEGDIWKLDTFIGQIVFEFCEWSIKKIPESKCYQWPSFYSNAITGEIIGNVFENSSKVEL